MRGPSAWLYDTTGGTTRTSSGQGISPDTALSLSAVYASIRAISEDIAGMPLKAYRRLPGGGKQVASDETKWRSDYINSDVNHNDLSNKSSNPDMTNMAIRSLVLWWAQLYGSGYTQIIRDGEGRAIGFNPIHPHRVRLVRDTDVGSFYVVRDPAGIEKDITVFEEDMIKIIGPSENGFIGNMITEYGAESFGIYMAAERHTGSFFGRGATLAGVVSFDNKFESPEARKLYRDEFDRVYAGAGNANKWMITDSGAKVQTLGVNPEDAQLIDTLKFRIEDVARWFRVPPVIIGHNTSTPYANIQPLGQFYFNFGLKPWAIRVEQEYNRKLSPDGGLFFEHVVDSLMWADPKTRAEYHNLGIRGGWRTPNEAREIENLNPYEGGDRFRVEQNLALLDEDGVPQQANTPAPPARVGGSTDAVRLAMMPVFVDAAERIIARESLAINGKKNPDDAWLDQFYTKHRAAIVSILGGPVNSLSKLAGVSEGDTIERYADLHIGESRRRLASGDDPQAWNIDRPAWIARRMTDEVCNG